MDLKTYEFQGYKIGDGFLWEEEYQIVGGFGFIDGEEMVFASRNINDMGIEFYPYGVKDLPVNTSSEAALTKCTKAQLVNIIQNLSEQIADSY